MSQENAQAFRDSMDAFDRRDQAAWLAFRAADCVVVPSVTWPEAGTVRGREAAWDYYVQVVEAFDHAPVGDVEVVDAGNDTVLVHQRIDWRGRASGASVAFNYWIVITFRDGKIVRDVWFDDRAEAFPAAGLRE